MSFGKASNMKYIKNCFERSLDYMASCHLRTLMATSTKAWASKAGFTANLVLLQLQTYIWQVNKHLVSISMVVINWEYNKVGPHERGGCTTEVLK